MPPKKDKPTFESLGLRTPIPPSLFKTQREKKDEKYLAKKAHDARTREAISRLSETKEQIERHRDFEREEEERARAARDERRRALQAEHIKAQSARTAVERRRETALVEQQARVVERIHEQRAADEEAQRALRAAMQREAEERARAAPAAVHVPVARSAEIQEARLQLPVLGEEQAIVEAVLSARGGAVLVCGETGSGKTTQVPQFLWEAGFGQPEGAALGRSGIIAVTEPRRVAATAMARRVAEELAEEFGGAVGFHVRYENNVGPATRLKFMTEGVLLREIQSDFLLRRYSAVVVDEAHERSVQCDILVGLLSRIAPLRQSLADSGEEGVTPLKLIIMSATLRVADFQENPTLFPVPPPLINVEARRFPVSTHFARRTELTQYVGEAFAKVCQIHRRLPPGGILVFLSTQREVETLCARLAEHFKHTRVEYNDTRYTKKPRRRQELFEEDEEGEKGANEAAAQDEFGMDAADYALEGDEDFEAGSSGAEDGGDPAAALLARMTGGKRAAAAQAAAGEEEEESSGDDDEARRYDDNDAAAEAEEGELDTLYVLPLYALLNAADQQRVFRPPPPGRRLCVVATNVAETSITIPNVRYVVDSGRVKTKTIDPTSGASHFRIEWTSQASAEQRAGRAGRTGPGHCYRLYSTAVFANHMPKHAVPELLRTPLESVVLMMKHLRIDHVANFPFPTPPRKADIEGALHHLAAIGALDAANEFRVTSLGMRLAQLPVPPRFARMLAEGQSQRFSPALQALLVAAVAVAATTLDVFEFGVVEELRRTAKSKPAAADGQPQQAPPPPDPRKALMHAGSDLLSFLRAICVFARTPTVAAARRWSLVHKSLKEAMQLCYQLARQLAAAHDGDDALDDERDADDAAVKQQPLPAPEFVAALPRDDEVALRKAFAAGLIDQVARRAAVAECRSHGVPFADHKTSKAPYIDVRTASIVYIHPSSSVAATHPPPEWVVYAGLQRTRRQGSNEEPRTFMKGVTVVTRQWLDDVGFVDPEEHKTD